jgi:sulfonate transport system ATP-binding protein
MATRGQAGVITRRPVELRSVTRRFGDRAVLDDIDLTVEAGEFVALLGRSGTGKSTLLRLLSGYDRGASGDVSVTDHVAVAFQDSRLLPWLKVVDNVTLGLPGKQAAVRARAQLDEVGLGDKAGEWPGVLSGGEAQRAALARALIREPELLLLDEPFAALDALTRISMHHLLRRLCDRHHPSVLLVTHDVDEAVLLADRVLVLEGGRLAHDVPVDLPRPRSHDDPRFVAIRRRLLTALGVPVDGV